MTVVTIPKKLAQEGDLVVISRKEYEAFLKFKNIREFRATKAQKRAFARAEENFKKGKTLSLNEFSRKLGFTN